jgi:hypothetical protein
LPFFDLNEAQDATHAMHGVDPSLLALQSTHPLSSHFLKRLVVVVFCLPLLDITNFMTMREVPLPSLNKKEETHVAIHIIIFVCFCHIFLLGHIYVL